MTSIGKIVDPIDAAVRRAFLRTAPVEKRTPAAKLLHNAMQREAERCP